MTPQKWGLGRETEAGHKNGITRGLEQRGLLLGGPRVGPGLLMWALPTGRVRPRWRPGGQEGGAREASIQVWRMGGGGVFHPLWLQFFFILSGFNSSDTPLSPLTGLPPGFRAAIYFPEGHQRGLCKSWLWPCYVLSLESLPWLPTTSGTESKL